MIQILKTIIRVLELDERELLDEAELPVDFLRDNKRDVTPRQRHAAGLAIERLSGRDDIAYHLAMFRARTPRPGGALAFANCDTIKSGIERLAILKPANDGSALCTHMLSDRFRIEIKPVAPDVVLLHWAVLCDILYIVELCRNCTARHIVPRAVGMMDASRIRPEDIAFLGVTPVESKCAFVEFTLPDISLRLLTARDDFTEMNADRGHPPPAPKPISQQVSQALAEMLSSRRFGIEDVSHHLNINARKLQRLLRAEGGSFRDVLDETRKALALAHLKEEHRSVAEVSHLLGYHDPNSFYRAFKGWTGTTTTSWRHEE